MKIRLRSSLILISLFAACRQDNVLTRCDPAPSQALLMRYTNAEGVIRRYPSPGSFYLELTQCTNCQRFRPSPAGLTAPPSPCNLPASFQQEGLAVRFSGLLWADTTRNYTVIDLSGIPLQLTAIHRR